MSGTDATNTTGRPPRHARRELLAGVAVLLGGAELPAAAGAAPGADADIIAVCERFVAAELEWQRLLYLGDTAQTQDAADAFGDGEYSDAMDAVAELPPATTMAGLRAKARAVVAFYDPDPPDAGSVFDAAVWEVLLTLAGPEVLAQLHRQRPVRSRVQS